MAALKWNRETEERYRELRAQSCGDDRELRLVEMVPTAFHEAGHAVMNILNGGTPMLAAVLGRPMHLSGYMLPGETDYPNAEGAFPSARKVWTMEVHEALAGLAAESLLDRKEPDWESLLAIANFTPNDDIRSAWEAARFLGKRDIKYLRRALHNVRRRLWKEWAAVNAIAGELIARRRVRKRRLMELAREGGEQLRKMPEMEPPIAKAARHSQGMVLPARQGARQAVPMNRAFSTGSLIPQKRRQREAGG